MKIVNLLFLALIISLSASAQDNDTKDPLEKFSVFKCLKQDRTTYIKQTEVSIAEWFAFIFDTYEDEWRDQIKRDLTSMLPDSIVDMNKHVFEIFYRNWDPDAEGKKNKWDKSTIPAFPMFLTKKEKKDYKDKISPFMHMPITGISLSQVQNFIGWKEDKLNDLYGNDSLYLDVKLMTDAMYDSLIPNTIESRRIEKDKEGNSLVVGDSANIKGCFLFNFKGSANCPASEGRKKMYGTLKGPVGVYSYMPDGAGFYNLLGNVAEMTKEGNSRGGHYEMYAKDILENKAREHSDPIVLVGFRYWVELVEDK